MYIHIERRACDRRRDAGKYVARVCVGERERERKRERKKESVQSTYMHLCIYIRAV